MPSTPPPNAQGWFGSLDVRLASCPVLGEAFTATDLVVGRDAASLLTDEPQEVECVAVGPLHRAYAVDDLDRRGVRLEGQGR